MALIQLAFVVIIIAVFLAIVYHFLKSGVKALPALIANTFLGFVAMFLLNFIGIHIPINILTLIIAAIFGMLGVAVLTVLSIFGML